MNMPTLPPLFSLSPLAVQAADLAGGHVRLNLIVRWAGANLPAEQLELLEDQLHRSDPAWRDHLRSIVHRYDRARRLC
ncbi:MAG: hypothetical protein ACLFV3_13050 [Phycisphaeraceae bacterium]